MGTRRQNGLKRKEEFRRAMQTLPPAQRCRVCGTTDDDWDQWAEDDLCSACAPAVIRGCL